MNPSKENDCHDTVGESCLQLSFCFHGCFETTYSLVFSVPRNSCAGLQYADCCR